MTFPSSPSIGSIQAANAGNTVATLTENSYVGMAITGTTGTCNINGSYIGQLAFYYSPDGSALDAVPSSNVAGTGGTTGIQPDATGQYTITGISGNLIIAAPSYASGVPNIVLFVPSSGEPEGDVTLGPGTAIVGKVGIDQTTPGTTNGVQVNAALPAGSNTIGAVGINPPTVTRQQGKLTVNGSAQELTASSYVLQNGLVLVPGPTNTGYLYSGGAGVTTSTGTNATNGMSYGPGLNINAIYIIGTVTTDTFSWEGS